VFHATIKKQLEKEYSPADYNKYLQASFHYSTDELVQMGKTFNYKRVRIMLSLSKPLKAGDTAQYHKKDDYYLQEGGFWQGKGAEELGLSGQINHDDFSAVLKGLRPGTEEKLRQDKNSVKERAANDITFSAPKSISILALADERVKTAHDKAVSRVLDFIEQNNTQARVQKNGDRRAVHTGNMVVGKFDHITSRAMDPQLHTHCVVANLTMDHNGNWKALHNDSIFKDQLVLGRIYRNELAYEMKAIGYGNEIISRDDSFFESKGVEKGLRDGFSTRRKQVEKKVKEFKEAGLYSDLSDAKVHEIAALGSRAKKDQDVDKLVLRQEWMEIIKNITGKSLDEIKKDALRLGKENEATIPLNEAIARASELITLNDSVFMKKNVLAITAKLTLGNYNLTELENAFEKQIELGKLIKLGEKTTAKNGIDCYTTPSMQRTENDVLEMVNRSKDQFKAMGSPEEINNFLDQKEKENSEGQGGKKFKFKDAQRKAAIIVLSSTDRVNIIQGDAGTGKTAYTKIINNFAESKNRKVFGIGFTGKAAMELNNVGIEAYTIDAFLGKKIEHDGVKNIISDEKSIKLKQGDILLMDEASMTGSRHLNKLLKLTEAANVKLVIQGDSKQLSSISAGRMHDILQSKTDVARAVLTEGVRQKEGSFAHENFLTFQNKGLPSVVDNLEEQKNLFIRTKKKELIKGTIGAYLKMREEGKTVILTDLNKDKNHLNKLIRKSLIESGELKKQDFEFDVLTSKGLSGNKTASSNFYKVGQKLSFNERFDGRIKINDLYKISEVDGQKNKIKVDGEAGKPFWVNLNTNSDKITIFEKDKRQFSKGDEVVFLKNDKNLKVQNGTLGKVVSVKKNGTMRVAVTESGKTDFKEFRMSDSGENKYQYIDHGYALTVHKSQGATFDNTVVYHNGKEIIGSANSFYVATTRAKEKTQVFTNDVENLKDQSFKWQRKASTLDDYSVELKSGKEILDKLMPEEKELPNVQIEIPEVEKSVEKQNIENCKDGAKKEERELQLERSL
jgi:conjugative relaxase-like TrwC/TraI family protein